VRLLARPLAGIAAGVAALVAATASSGCWLTRSFDVLDCTTTCDAGPADTGKPEDTGTDAASANPCTNGSAFLCENFEHGLSASMWTQSLAGSASTVSVDSSRKERGTSSLHSHIDADGSSGQSAKIRASISLPGTFFARWYVYAASPGIATNANVGYPETFAMRPNYDTLELRVEGPANARTFGFGNSLGNTFVTSKTPVPFDAWTCIEWQITPQQTYIWVNGTELGDISVATTTQPVVQMFFGWSILGAAPGPADVWTDEIIVALARVGCSVFQE
jgi:hypothetical protein